MSTRVSDFDWVFLPAGEILLALFDVSFVSLVNLLVIVVNYFSVLKSPVSAPAVTCFVG